MRLIATILAALIAIALLAAACVGLLFAIRYVLDLFGEAGPPWSSITAATVVIVLLASLFIAGTIREGKRWDVSARLTPRRAEVYGRILTMWAQGWTEATTATAPADTRPHEAERDLLLWASDRVIQAYYELQQCADDEDADEDELRDYLDELLRAMRQDLGRSSAALESGVLSDVWLGPPKD